MRYLLFLLASISTFSVSAQLMSVKQPNFTSFKEDLKKSTKLLDKYESDAVKRHPEYGILPYNAQCSECVELIEQRTQTTRLFIDPKDEKHTYSQSSFFPLHYKNRENDIWRTIDKRLRPDAHNPGIYVAKNQPTPTKLDLNKKSTSLLFGGFEFEFNKSLSLYFFNDQTVYTRAEAGDYSNKTVGEEGLSVSNIWPGIDMHQVFNNGEIETNYTISKPLQLPISSGWMVIEDHFTLPDNYKFIEASPAMHTFNGVYSGDYYLINATGDTLATYQKPIYIDTRAFGMHGFYILNQTGNDYTLKTLVPVDWLNKADNVYPLVIDPTVTSISRLGNFASSGQQPASLAFTSMSLGSCNYHMGVYNPSGAELSKVYVDLEYILTYDNTCGTPPLPSPYCTVSQVGMTVVSDACNKSVGPLSCNPAQPPFTGTCTTDPNLVPGAHSIELTNLDTSFVSCIRPQCAGGNVNFTLKNRDSICGDVCGYLCARGNIWQMTIESYTGGSISVSPNPVCPGLADTLTITANGVPPFKYLWPINGQVDTTLTPYYIIHPQQSLTVQAGVIDSCGHSNITDTLNISVLAAPNITVINNSLTSSIQTGCQWYLNDSAIAGATNYQYTPTQPGFYSVSCTGAPCRSLPVNVSIGSGIGEVDGLSENLKVIPNPSNGNFIVRFTSSDYSNVTLKLIDAVGRVIESKQEKAIAGINDYTLVNHAKLPTGVYYIELTAGTHAVKQKLLITE